MPGAEAITLQPLLAYLTDALNVRPRDQQIHAAQRHLLLMPPLQVPLPFDCPKLMEYVVEFLAGTWLVAQATIVGGSLAISSCTSRAPSRVGTFCYGHSDRENDWRPAAASCLHGELHKLSTCTRRHRHCHPSGHVHRHPGGQ